MFQFQGKSPVKQGGKYCLNLGQNVLFPPLSLILTFPLGWSLFIQGYDG